MSGRLIEELFFGIGYNVNFKIFGYMSTFVPISVHLLTHVLATDSTTPYHYPHPLKLATSQKYNDSQ